MKGSRLALRSLGPVQCKPIRCRNFQYMSSLKHDVIHRVHGERNPLIVFGRFLSSSASNASRRHQAQAVEFLDELKSGKFQPSIAPQRVEQLLLDLLKDNNTPDDGPLSLQLLNAAIMHANLPNERLIPRLFSLACQIMARSGHPLAQNEVHRQIGRLLEGNKDFLIKDVPYNTHHVNDACVQLISLTVSHHGRRHRMDHKSAQKMKRLIAELKRQYKDSKIPLRASAEACNAFIMHYCNIGNPNQALEELHWMLDDSSKSKLKLEPKISSFSLVISGFANDGNPDKATEIIQWMLSCYKDEASRIPAPNRACFNGLLHAWAKSGRKDAGLKAEQVLDWMQQLYQSEQLDTQPDNISFASSINAWARCSGPESPARAEALLHKMLTLHESGDGDSIKPSLSAFCSVMDAWAGSGDRLAPQKVEELLNIVEVRSGTIDDDFELTAFPYTILVKAWERAARGTKNRKQQMEYSDNAFKAITRMQNWGIIPPPASYNAMIVALHSSSPINAIFYFLHLEEQYNRGELKLDTRTFNCGLNAIATIMKPDAAEKAMEMLARMKSYAKDDPSVHPDETTFNIILKVLSRSNLKDAAHQADKLLQDMIVMKSIRPSHVSYSTCIIAWGRSQDKDKIQRVKKLLSLYEKFQKRNTQSSKTSNAVYNAVLSVCYHNGSGELQEQAQETATLAMKKLRSAKLKADKATYESFFRSMASTPVDASKEALVETEFGSCIEDGLVSMDSFKAVEAAFPSVIDKYLGGNQGSTGKSIPEQWFKRIRSGSR